jgi:hypothetical protein
MWYVTELNLGWIIREMGIVSGRPMGLAVKDSQLYLCRIKFNTSTYIVSTAETQKYNRSKSE